MVPNRRALRMSMAPPALKNGTNVSRKSATLVCGIGHSPAPTHTHIHFSFLSMRTIPDTVESP